MLNLGPAELLMIFIVALLVFGPNKLPEIGRQVGKAIREFRRMQSLLNDEFREAVGDQPPRPAAAATDAWRPGTDPVPAGDPAAGDAAGDASEEAAAITHPDTPVDEASPRTDTR